nr:MAG TPA: hypothetical protein [Siphoviridae sp. ctngg6]
MFEGQSLIVLSLHRVLILSISLIRPYAPYFA